MRCNVSNEKVQLFDAIYNGDMAKICERCSIIENIPLIKKHDTIHLKDSEKLRKERLKELEENPILELPIEEQLNLMEHFDWQIMKIRRKKGLSHKQLGEAISEPEISLEILEKGKIPENAEQIIRKLEQFFQVNLRNITEAEEFLYRKNRMIRTKPVLLDEYGYELQHIPEPEISLSIEEKPEEILMMEKEKSGEENLKKYSGDNVFKLGRPWRRGKTVLQERKIEEKKIPEDPAFQLNEDEDLELNKVDASKVTIKDLKEVHKKRIIASKEERIEEQRKIEKRQRFIEAKKEESRLIKERQSKNIDSVLGGSELLNKKKPDDEFKDLEK